jgi:hypothetical protein
LTFILLYFGIGCAPPDAPQTLDQLGSYLFEEFENSDIRYMEEGIKNLHEWVEENREDVQEGYRIENLTIEAVAALNVTETPNLEGLIGAAVATDISFSVEETLTIALETDPIEIDPDAYGYFNRTWAEDPECFLSKECTEITYVAEIQNNFPLGIVTESKTIGTYKWFFLEEGDFATQRRWLLEPAISNQDWLEVNQDYAISVYIPTEIGMRFMDIEWVVTKLGDIPVPEDFALSLAISAMSKGRKNIEAYLEENQ